MNFVDETKKRFVCWFMDPGPVNYLDVKGGDVELIRKETIDEALDSLIGCPLTIGHIDTSMTSFEDVAHGTVDKASWDAEKGKYKAEGTVETDQARENIAKDWGISVGTKLNRRDFGPGGTWHNIPYGREINKFRFHHLALIDPSGKPRFEDAEIRLNALKPAPDAVVPDGALASDPNKQAATADPSLGGGPAAMLQTEGKDNAKGKNSMFKWIKKALAGGQTTEQASDLAPTARVDLGGGKSATLEELVAVTRNNAGCYVLSRDDEVECDGMRYNAGALMDGYKAHMERCAADESAAAAAKGQKDGAKGESSAKTEEEFALEQAKAGEAAARDNAVKQAAADELARENAKKLAGQTSFKALAGASAVASRLVVTRSNSGSTADKVARGRKLFGSN